MTNIELAINTLLHTKNRDKITTDINRLSLKEKIALFSEEKIQTSLLKVFDEAMYVRFLIDLPIEIRISLLKKLFISPNFKMNNKILMKFLLLEDFDNFDVSLFEKISDNSIIPLMFRKLGLNNLIKIFNDENLAKLHGIALIEISKKSKQFTLMAEDLNKIDLMTLAVVLKQRNTKEKVTSITCDEFMKLDDDRQRIVSNYIQILFEEVAKCYNNEIMMMTDAMKIERFNNLLNNINGSQIQMLKLKLIVCNFNESLAKELAKKFIHFSMKSECELPDNFINSILFQLKQLNSDNKKMIELSKLGKPFAVVKYLKTEIIDGTTDRQYNDTITLEQFIKTNTKHVSKILDILNEMYNNYTGTIRDEQLANHLNRFLARRNNFLINEKGNVLLAYKLYYILGYENTIELLSGKHGKISLYNLYKLFYVCDIKQVEFAESNNRFVPILDTNLINFLIGDKKDNNSTIKRILRNELDEVYKSFPYIYNNFRKIQALIGDKIHLNKLLPLLQNASFPLLPNEYKLNKELIDKIIKSYGYEDMLQMQTEDKQVAQEAINQAINFYHNYLEKRLYSSMPRVFGTTKDNYSYEILKLDDPIVMTVGYETGCCFRLNGESKEFLKYCSSNENGRVLIIRNEFGELVAMTPIVRNGNVVAGNSIESKKSKSEGYKVYEAYKQAMNDIISISVSNEETPIIGAVVTDLHGNVVHNSKQKINNNIYPLFPGIKFYNNYSSPQYLVSIADGKFIDNFQSFMPQAIYMDERPNLLYSGPYNEQDEDFDNRLKSILFQKGKLDEEQFQYLRWHYRGIIFGEDWYVGISYNQLEGDYLEKDWRAQVEFEATKEYLESILSDDKYFRKELEINDVTSKCLCRTLIKRENSQQMI